MTNNIDTWKLVGEEQREEREQALRRDIKKAKSFVELKSILSRNKDIIHRDTDYRIQNIIATLNKLDFQKLSLADMPEQYGIKSKLVELRALDKDHLNF